MIKESSNFWKWVDRSLIFCVLLLQIAILSKRNSDRPAVSNREGDTPRGEERRSSPILDTKRPAVNLTSKRSTWPNAQNSRRNMIRPANGTLSGSDIREHAYSRMEDLFEQAVRDLDRLRYLDREWDSLMLSPAMDMGDDGTNYLVNLCVPGARAEDVAVVLKGRLLSVDVPMGREQGELKMFSRRVLLPGEVGPCEMASAVLTNGVLRILVPKCKERVDTSVSIVAYRLM